MHAQAVPEQLRRLWRLPHEPARLGRRSRLDVDAVVSTAVRLADEGGLEAATLPRIAGELGVTAMSLYRHVGSKDELLQLMVDAASEPDDPGARDAGDAPGAPAAASTVPAPADGDRWREGLHRWALDLWRLYRRRPWIPHVPVHRMPSGPHQLAWVERGLAHLEGTELSWGQKIAAITVLSSHVRQSVLLSQELAAGRPPDQNQAHSEHETARALGHLVSADRFPQAAQLFAAEVFTPSDEPSEATEHADLLVGIDLLLDGLQRRVTAEAAPAAGTAP